MILVWKWLKGVAESQFKSTAMNNETEDVQVWWDDHEEIKKHITHLALCVSLMLSVIVGAFFILSCIKKR